MDEAAAKARLLTYVRQKSGGALPMVTAEMTLGKSGVRADLAIMANAELIGFEIKTARDTLRRLPAQMEGYARFFDHSIIAVAEKHLPALAEINLHGASIWLIDSAKIQVRKVGLPNAISPAGFLELMTQEERRTLKGESAEAIRTHYEAVFSKRYGRSSDTFWAAVKGRRVRGEHMRHLSRFAERREALAEIEKEKDARWREWSQAHRHSDIYA